MKAGRDRVDVRDGSKLGAQPGRPCHLWRDPLHAKALGSVRADGDLCCKSSKCVQAGEPNCDVLISLKRCWLKIVKAFAFRFESSLGSSRKHPKFRFSKLPETDLPRRFFAHSPSGRPSGHYPSVGARNSDIMLSRSFRSLCESHCLMSLDPVWEPWAGLTFRAG